jgi:hemerythrin-like metal-binding protein
MSSLVWSEALSLSMPAMDQTHQEFVELLSTVEASDDAHLLAHWDALLDHTQDHFDREDAWMQATGFAPVNCHSTQHNVVLTVMREGQVAGQQGKLDIIRMMTHELGLWFAQHAQTMDASLALHLKSMGFDPLSAQALHPARLPQTPITSCGGQCHETSPA